MLEIGALLLNVACAEKLFVFVNVVDKVVLIFKNTGLDVSSGNYVFPAGALFHSFSTSEPLDLEDCSKYK